MIRTNDRSLEQTPDVFESIGVSKAAHVFALVMINRNMDRVVITNSKISKGAVSRNDFGLVGQFCFQERAKRSFVNTVLAAVGQSNVAVAFNRAKDHALADRALLASFAFGCMHPLHLAAYEGFIAFNKAAVKTKQRYVRILNRFADTMTKIPRRFVCHAQHALE